MKQVRLEADGWFAAGEKTAVIAQELRVSERRNSGSSFTNHLHRAWLPSAAPTRGPFAPPASVRTTLRNTPLDWQDALWLGCLAGLLRTR